MKTGFYGGEVDTRGLKGLTGLSRVRRTVSDSDTGQDSLMVTWLAPVRAGAFAGASRIQNARSSPGSLTTVFGLAAHRTGHVVARGFWGDYPNSGAKNGTE